MDLTAEALDLESYFRRIGYDGPRAPTLETLAALHLNHPLAIAFENLDPLLGRPVRLDLASLQAKLVESERGGYCFEQNLLFMAALGTLGFKVSGLAARVLWNRPGGAVTPHSHMLLRVELPDGSYIADVGFGGLTLTAPLRLAQGEQQTPHETFRLDRDGEGFRMLAQVGGEWRPLYRFGLEQQFLVDYEVSNYFVATNPNSHFVHTLIAARPTREGRRTLLNTKLSAHGGGRSEARELATADDIAAALRNIFGIAVPDRAAFVRSLQREAII